VQAPVCAGTRPSPLGLRRVGPLFNLSRRERRESPATMSEQGLQSACGRRGGLAYPWAGLGHPYLGTIHQRLHSPLKVLIIRKKLNHSKY